MRLALISLFLTACVQGQGGHSPRPVPVKLQHFAQSDFERLNFLLGCWEAPPETPREPGQVRVLRITRNQDVFNIAAGSVCANDLPLLSIYFRDGLIIADQQPLQVFHGMIVSWTASVLTDEELQLRPQFASVFQRFKLMSADTLEWSTAPADGSEKPSGFLLKRVKG